MIDYKFDHATPFDIDLGYSKVEKKGKKYWLDTDGNEYPLAESLTEVDSNTLVIDLSLKNLKVFPLELLQHSQIQILYLQHN